VGYADAVPITSKQVFRRSGEPYAAINGTYWFGEGVWATSPYSTVLFSILGSRFPLIVAKQAGEERNMARRGPLSGKQA
jgi:hypothetical protein